MSRSHRPPTHRHPSSPPDAVPPATPRTALGVVPFALGPPAVVLVVDRPLTAVPVVAALVVAFVALVAARRVATLVAPRRVAVRVPVVRFRVEVDVTRIDRRS